MVELRTRYLGLDLPSPLVASASPLTGTLDGLRRLEAAGAAAVVLPSLFEEQLTLEADQVGRLREAGADSLSAALALDDYNAGPYGYLALVEKATATLQIPVIASLNGVTPGAWVKHASLLEEAGADALELNIYYVLLQPRGGRPRGRAALPGAGPVGAPDDRDPAGGQAQPVFQLSRQPDPPAGPGGRRWAGAVQPLLPARPRPGDPGGHPSPGAVELEELRLPLRWIAILYKEVPASLAASTGVHTAADVVKVLLAGADVAMMTSALLRHGPEHLTAVETGLRDWLEEHGMQTVGHLRGLRSQRSIRDPAAWERANYITMLAGYPDQVHTEAR